MIVVFILVTGTTTFAVGCQLVFLMGEDEGGFKTRATRNESRFAIAKQAWRFIRPTLHFLAGCVAMTGLLVTAYGLYIALR